MGLGEPHRWQLIGDLLVSFTGAGAISDETWGRFAADMASPTTKGLLACTVGDIDVTSTQRKMGADASVGKKMPVAVVADGKVVRGMVTAVAWLGVNIKAFDWNQLPQALQFLKATSTQERRAIEVVRRFRDEA